MKKQTILGSLCLFALLFATSACPGPKNSPSDAPSDAPKLGFVANSLSIDPPSTAAAVDVSITIQVSVENTGTAASSGGTVTLHKSSDDIIENSDPKVDGTTAIAIPVIQAGAKLAISGTFTISKNTDADTYHYGACISTTTICSEVATLTVVDAASFENLVLENFVLYPASPVQGDSLSIDIDLRNSSDMEDSPGGALTFYQSSPDATTATNSDLDIGTAIFEAIAPEGTHQIVNGGTGANLATIPSTTAAGTYYYIACISGTDDL